MEFILLHVSDATLVEAENFDLLINLSILLSYFYAQFI